MQDFQQQFLNYVTEHEILRFGEFTLKSGRQSPYFFNAGLFNTGGALDFLGACYAKAIKGGLRIKKYALPPGVQPGAHGGSHGYLGHDFIDAILRNRKPRVDVIDALNMTVPGYYAHLSAMKDGETMKIPQYSI